MSSDSPNRAITFEIEAPARTNLKLSTVNGGEILVENIEGDLEVSNVNGSVTLNGVAGSVMAGTTNGSVRATLTRVTDAREMAFTSLNGTVDVTLPPTTKANLRLRSDHGDVYSDFDVQLAPSSAPVVEENRAATAAIASAVTDRSSARSTAAARNSSCGRSTATSTSAKASSQ